MATSETEFQRELISAADKVGMHAFKASHRDKVGVVDLWCRTESFGAWIECKWMNVFENSFRTKKVPLSRPQWSFMNKEREAGGVTGKIIGFRLVSEGKHDAHGLLICDPRNQETQVMRPWIDDEHYSRVMKPRGEDWPIKSILNQVWTAHEGLADYIDRNRT